MKLGRCPECGQVINLDDMDELEETDIIGCGFMEGDMEFCDDCACEYDSTECKDTRIEEELSTITAGEYNDNVF